MINNWKGPELLGSSWTSVHGTRPLWLPPANTPGLSTQPTQETNHRGGTSHQAEWWSMFGICGYTNDPVYEWVAVQDCHRWAKGMCFTPHKTDIIPSCLICSWQTAHVCHQGSALPSALSNFSALSPGWLSELWLHLQTLSHPHSSTRNPFLSSEAIFGSLE